MKRRRERKRLALSPPNGQGAAHRRLKSEVFTLSPSRLAFLVVFLGKFFVVSEVNPHLVV